KSRERSPSARPISGAAAAARGGRGVGGALGGSPNGRRPMSRGWSRISKATSGSTTRATPATSSTALRQPRRTTIEASRGRNRSWPVAELAVSRRSTTPRRSVNQRLATGAASPPDAALERDHPHAGGGPNPRRSQEGHEGHRHDDPAIVHAPPHPSLARHQRLPLRARLGRTRLWPRIRLRFLTATRSKWA